MHSEDPTPIDGTANAAGASKPNGTKTGVDIDWDDEDEATTVFDRSQEDAAHALLRSAPPPPPAAGMPAPPRVLTPPPAAGMPAAARTVSVPPPAALPRVPVAPPTRPTVSSSLPPAPYPASATLSSDPAPGLRANKKTIIVAGAAALVVVVVAAVVALLPGQGSLVVTVAGPGNKPVSEMEIYVDGQKRCATSPCQIKDLAVGTHLVRITAPGYEQTADQAVKVSSGDEAIHNVALTRAGGTGLVVKAEGRGLKLSIDGKEIGPLPQELPDLAPGEHLVSIDGGDRYESFERRVTIDAGQLVSLEPKLKVKKGLATIKPGLNAEDARVVLVSGNERRPVPQLPLAVDIPVDKGYRIVATKRGFQDFEQRLDFEEGQAERTFVVDMVPAIAAEGPAAPVAAAPPVAMGRPAPVAAAPAAPPAAKAAATTLTLNSVPASNVILDGRPLGPTPKVNVSVTPGTHTVIFVHPEHGRKAKSVTVAAGKSVPVVVQF